MWKGHVNICLIMIALAVPLFLADMYLFKNKGGGWISLDLRGFLIVPYLIFVVLHIGLSTLALKLFSSTQLAAVHGATALLVVMLMLAGFFVYDRTQRSLDRARYARRMQEVDFLGKVIELKSWWYVPDGDQPQEIHVQVRVTESGRFAGNINASAAGEYGPQIFHSTDVKQRKVVAGEEFVHVFPITIANDGEAAAVSIALSLFKDETGSAPENVSIIFEQDPKTDYDGHFIYKPLPLPSVKPQ